MPKPTDAPDSSAVLTAAAHELAELAGELGLPAVAEQIRRDASRRIEATQLRVAVLGEVNHGKSSLINALVRADVLPTSAIPTTHRAIAVRSGEATDTGYFVLQDGTRTKVNRAAFDACVRDAQGRADELEAVCSAEHLPSCLEVFDTPGLNDLDHFHEAVARRQLPSADVVVLVLDATQVLSRTERHSLDDALAAVGGRRSGVVFELVINRIDLVAERDRALIVEHVREQLQGLPFETLDPFLTDARRQAADRDPQSFGVREVDRLRDRLLALAEHRNQLLPRRARAELWRQAQLLAAHAAIRARAARLDADALEHEIAGVREALQAAAVDIDALRERVATGSAAILEGSRTRIAEQRTAMASGLDDEIRRADIRQLSEIVPGALRDAHLQFARTEAERVRDELEQLTRSVLSTHGEQVRRRLHRTTLALGFRGPVVHIEPPSLAIEAGTLVLGAVGTAVMYFGSMATGLIMAVASPLTHVLLRERTIRRARAQAGESIPRALDRAAESLQRTIERVVLDHRDSLDRYVTSADQALADQLVSVLTHAHDDATSSEDPEGPTSIETRIAAWSTRLEPADRLAAEPTAASPEV